jgi:leucyl/phenylalanyl-tRNA---protein transferase
MPKDHQQAVTAQILLEFYQKGMFPMAESADETGFYLMNPPTRAVFTPQTFHIPRSLQKFRQKTTWRVTMNENFTAVIDLCRAKRADRSETWINHDIRDLFVELHLLGHAHSIEVWDDLHLIGGLYGLSVGRVFCAESMVSLESNASSLALITLMEHLIAQNYTLCDVQYTNPHLERFHCHEITQDEYLQILIPSLTAPSSMGKLLKTP